MGCALFAREYRPYSWSGMWAVLLVGVVAAIGWAAFFAWWRAEPAKGLLPAVAFVFPLLPPQAYVLNSRGVWRGPAPLMYLHRRRASPGQLVVGIDAIEASTRSHWHGRPAIVVYRNNGNEELLCPADPRQVEEIMEWLRAYAASVS